MMQFDNRLNANISSTTLASRTVVMASYISSSNSIFQKLQNITNNFFQS